MMRPPTRMIPLKDNLLQFTDFNKMERVPFVVYADTEALLIKPEQELFKTMSTNSTLEDSDDRVKNYYKVLLQTLEEINTTINDGPSQ